MSMCCPDCFSDVEVQRRIRELSDRRGFCTRCETEGSDLIAVSELVDSFSILSLMYEPSDAGQDLSTLVQNDWSIFSAKLGSVSELLALLFPPYAATKGFSVINGGDSALESWRALRDELKSVNRFFPKNAPDPRLFSELLGRLVIHRSALSPNFYRARIRRGEAPLVLADLGAPPADRATAGRANPEGIPYLYLASDLGTAIAEVRPSVGDEIAIARFTPATDFSIIDLASPTKSISPFTLDVDDISNVHASMKFLCALSDDLSLPLPPHRIRYDYVATQFLCELIKSLGYDGVRYRSSLGGGRNFVMFYPDRFAAVVLEPPVMVDSVAYGHKSL